MTDERIAELRARQWAVAYLAVDECLDEIERLREALIGVTPSHRAPGKCWCEVWWVVAEPGHSEACRKAKEVLGEKE